MTNCSPACPRKATGTCYNHHGCRCDVCKAIHRWLAAKNRAKRDAASLPESAHGNVSIYSNWNCRCQPCTAAATAVNVPLVNAFRKRKKGQPVPEGVHGTLYGYNTYACRCRPCKDANAEGSRKYRQRKPKP